MPASRFFKWPRELRDIVYEFALTGSNGQLVCRKLAARPPLSNRFPYYGKAYPKHRFPYHRRAYPEHGFKLYLNAPSDCVANNLLYVCRPLYDETKGLAEKFNDIVFIQYNMPDMSDLMQFRRFVSFGPYGPHILRVILKTVYNPEHLGLRGRSQRTRTRTYH
ncbi:hypothetical protein EK21DRAFT_81243 [Setomelanomma holmii]|uniref:Uncharacterized protein n=1 Tax=Setomelanomma holmii TaxID=210430 RepID=A0A9P4LG86_9PLEO|nr:hypothetical protein EK21DRAFT_81243 [Setomelanomma holmii]